jgi:tetratricopeptide (TPR) repeat protein
VLLSQHFLDRAARLLADVFTWFPESAELYVTRGLIAEIPVGWLASTLRGEKPTVIDDGAAPIRFYVPPAGPNQGPAAAAANQYRQAIVLDPTSARAYLHLAWVHVRERDDRAVEDARHALQYAGNDDERYLAQLLLAAIAERNERYDDAIAAYSRARELGPRYQVACTGLANAYAAAGDAGAATTAIECLSLRSSAAQPDPWLVLRYGITEPAIVDWLDTEARRP